MVKSKKNILQQLKEEEKQKKKNLIIDAAISIFGKKTAEEIHLKDIAEELGISVPTIYQYFESRDDLFMGIFNQEILGIVKYIDKKMKAENENSLEAITKHLVNYFIKNQGGFKIITYFLVKDNVSIEVLKKTKKTISKFLPIIEDGFKSLEIEEDPLMLVHSLLGTIAGGMLVYKNYPNFDKKNAHKIIYSLANLKVKTFKNK
ncbi:MAG: TetR/AcrR family transcriptional regulator [Desulforegulaceae bacterium]|nr:TetR/AcrR family transcriptional regulator [Desulforegulaceae bacterium]